MRGNKPVVLKISKEGSDEWNAGEMLRAYDGDGVVRVYETAAGAVLMQRIEPGRQLVELVRQGHDDEATRILANVIRKMAHHTPPGNCATLNDWSRGFDRYLVSGDQQLPRDVVDTAHELYQRLTTSQGATMLLHGDLQHYNVLFDSRQGWVAIDPKGVSGELEYEVGAILRNPVELQVSTAENYPAAIATVERRLEILVSALNLDYRRTLQWSFAQAVLSVIWEIEDGLPIESSNVAFSLAHTLGHLL
jgi:streptomycin 6-kinase